jgi:hypothetical protein
MKRIEKESKKKARASKAKARTLDEDQDGIFACTEYICRRVRSMVSGPKAVRHDHMIVVAEDNEKLTSYGNSAHLDFRGTI